MWLEHICTLMKETNMNHLNCDLPMAIFMIKLLFTRIKFDNFANLQTYLDYIESSQSIELKYFIQSTIKEEINLECVLKEKEIDAEIEKIDEMFHTVSVEERIKSFNSIRQSSSTHPPLPVGPTVQAPTYEDRMILYKNYMIGKDIEDKIVDFWIQKSSMQFDNPTRVQTASSPWMLVSYYRYFNTEIDKKYYIHKRQGNNMRKINIYRQLEKDILNILNEFNTDKSFLKLLKSIRDVKLMKNYTPISP